MVIVCVPELFGALETHSKVSSRLPSLRCHHRVLDENRAPLCSLEQHVHPAELPAVEGMFCI